MTELETIHRRELAQWRQAMNLVGPGPLDPHFTDCHRALVNLEPQGRWVDLGSGAGFPGLVLAAREPALRLELVESRRKRCTFLEHVLLQARVPPTRVRVRCQRVESLEEAAYDGVVSRAFAPPPAVLEHAARLLVDGGLVVLMLNEGTPMPAHPAFSAFHVERYRVDGRDRLGAVLVRKDRPTI